MPFCYNRKRAFHYISIEKSAVFADIFIKKVRE